MFRFKFLYFAFQVLVLQLFSTLTFSQYPDRYIQYRNVPNNSCLWDKALALYGSSEIDSAIFYSNKAEIQFADYSDWEDYLFINNFKAQLLGETKRSAKAIEVLKKAYNKAKIQNVVDTLESIEFVENLFLTARVLTLQNDYKESEIFLLRTAHILEQSKRYPELLGIIYFNLSQINAKLMHSKRSMQYLIKVINTLKPCNNQYAKAISYFVQAESLNRSDPGLKTDFYIAAANAFEKGGYINDYYYNYSLMKLATQFTLYFPDYAKALFYSEQSELYAKRNRLSDARYYSLLLAKGDVYRGFNEYEKALSCFINASQMAIGCFGEKSFEYLLTNMYLGRLYRVMDNFPMAIKYYNTCYSIGKKEWKGKFPYEFSLYGEFSWLYSSLGNADSALFYAQKRLCYNYRGNPLSINEIPPVPDKQNIIRYYSSLSVKVSAYKQLYESTKDTSILPIALEHCYKADSLLKEINKNVAEEQSGIKNTLRTKLLSKYATYFYLQQYNISKDERYLKKAINYIERSQANYLKYMIDAKSDDIADNGQYKLKIKIAQFENKQKDCLSASDSSNYQQLNDSILSLKTQLVEKILSPRTLTCKPSQNKIEPSEFSVDSLQKLIPPETAILIFQKFLNKVQDEDAASLSDNNEKKQQVAAFYIDNEKVKYFSRDMNVKTNEDIETFIKSIKTGNMSDYLVLGKALYTFFIDSFSQELSTKKNIVIIPDAAFAEIPFDCLPQKNGNAICENYALSYHYSLNLWAKSHLHSNKHIASIAAIAPDFMENNGSINDDKMSAKTEVLLDQNKDIMRDDSHLVQLPKARDEVIQIGRLFKKTGDFDVKVVNKQITKEYFKKISGKYDILHIASHGIADLNDYRNSGIFFSSSNKAYDNFLHFDEIYNLNLKANLVVLSACKTSVGIRVSGEGIMALPRGFIYAGVPNVIASLWKVHDEKTKDLMLAFYKHLLNDNVNYAEALRRAKLDCIKKGFLPLDWAGFILIGE